MGKLSLKKKMGSRKTPRPGMPDNEPCWCESGVDYIDCHKLWDMIHERNEPPLICKKPGQ